MIFIQILMSVKGSEQKPAQHYKLLFFSKQNSACSCNHLYNQKQNCQLHNGNEDLELIRRNSLQVCAKKSNWKSLTLQSGRTSCIDINKFCINLDGEKSNETLPVQSVKRFSTFRCCAVVWPLFSVNTNVNF